MKYLLLLAILLCGCGGEQQRGAIIAISDVSEMKGLVKIYVYHNIAEAPLDSAYIFRRTIDDEWVKVNEGRSRTTPDTTEFLDMLRDFRYEQ